MNTNEPASDTVTIIQTYDSPIQIDLTDSHWGVLLIIVLVCMIWINLLCWLKLYYYNKHSIPLTSTEAITTLMDNLPHETEHLVRLILVDFCGYKSFDYQRYEYSKRTIAQIKPKFIRHELFGHTCFNLTMLILISSLLSAAYCGIIFLVQNDQYLKKYSTVFQCKFNENDTCIIDSDAVFHSTFDHSDDSGNNADFRYSDYNSFYNDTFIPYLQKLKDPTAIQRFENNPVLHISVKTQEVAEYAQGYYDSDKKWTGYLYLSESGISDSDFTLSSPRCDGCSGNDCFCLSKGDNGCECYRSKNEIETEAKYAKYYEAEHCCSCYCTCCNCWVGCAVFCALGLICVLLCISASSYVAIIGTVLEGIVEELKRMDYKCNDWMENV